ncbi:unnamed protein product [Paramecium octaurelia]|uniref:Uncharacterized protein n=1 Tax=Paramecium octaurelia TaxID=43137 RepID=A0A8S1T3U6_PAROT|nr:unnamed protein product [Paramecium octaurelia]
MSVARISIEIEPSTGHTAWHNAQPVHNSSIIVGKELKLSNLIAQQPESKQVKQHLPHFKHESSLIFGTKKSSLFISAISLMWCNPVPTRFLSLLLELNAKADFCFQEDGNYPFHYFQFKLYEAQR